MSSIGTGYDLAASTFSPDGRIFQVEYAQKAVDNSGTMIALRGKNGVVTAVEKTVGSKLYLPNANRRIDNVDVHIGFVAAGLYPDGRSLRDYAVEEALTYLKEYGCSIPIKALNSQIAEYVHIYTLGISRPFGCSVFLSSWNPTEGPRLHLIEPSGTSYEYRAWAIGKNRQAAKTEIEKLNPDAMDMEDLVRDAARIMITVRDEGKDKNVQIEMGWVGEATGGRHYQIPANIVHEAEEWAKKKIEEEEME